MSSNKEAWGSRVGLVLAMAGNAVGLGNFLRFPLQAVQNGGSAFMIPYITCFLLMGIPLLLVEWAIGRYGGNRGYHSTPFMMYSMDKRAVWKYFGVFGIFANIGIAAYYCYIESWTMSYTFYSATGAFNGMSRDQVAQMFSSYVDLGTFTWFPYESIAFFAACVLLNTYVLSRGLSGGVEKVAKVGMPLLILFGILLAIKAVTIKAGSEGAVHDGTVGLNYLWTPNFTSIWNPKVWLAAAGQIFFTLSLGMGSIQCYASYVKPRDDIALNAMSAGWMNEFVEVVLGGAIIIPIAVGYLGIDGIEKLAKLGGFCIGFKTLPFHFAQWGPLLAAAAGVMWFGLLFFAGVTSSLAMGVPCMGFLQDEFNWSRRRSAWAFGLTVLLLGLPTVFFFEQGVFDEYDYWTGTVSLFIFALGESILFAWFFGIEKGWKEINDGADIRIPAVMKYVIKYVTPVLLLGVFLGNLITPKGSDWVAAWGNLMAGKGWVLDNDCLLKKIYNAGLLEQIAATTDLVEKARLEKNMMLITGARVLLLALFLAICFLVYKASKKHAKAGVK